MYTTYNIRTRIRRRLTASLLDNLITDSKETIWQNQLLIAPDSERNFKAYMRLNIKDFVKTLPETVQTVEEVRKVPSFITIKNNTLLYIKLCIADARFFKSAKLNNESLFKIKTVCAHMVAIKSSGWAPFC